jgi:hypothetical protein
MTDREKALLYDKVIAYLHEQGGHPISYWVNLGKGYKALKQELRAVMEPEYKHVPYWER